MHQIDDSELRITILIGLKLTRRSVFKDASSGHQGTRDRGIDQIMEAVVERMKRWEIIVPEPDLNGFRDLTPPERAATGLPARD